MSLTSTLLRLYKLGYKHSLPQPNRVIEAIGNVPVPPTLTNKLFLANWDFLDYIETHKEEFILGVLMVMRDNLDLLTEEELHLKELLEEELAEYY